MIAAAAQRNWTPAPHGLPRVLAGLTADGRPVGLDAHLSLHGSLPGGGPDLIKLTANSGLLGRGGAAFPTGRKLAAVAEARQRPLVVVNAAEGEPASGKDRALVHYVPHLVLDGAVLAAQALGAREAVVAVGGGSEVEVAALSGAIGTRAKRRLDARVRLRAAAVPDTFLAGEETALVRFLGGGPANRPPVRGRTSAASSSRTRRRSRSSRWSRGSGRSGSVSSVRRMSLGRLW